MNKEDYFKYYIQGSEHYLIPKDEFVELFDEMVNWREESKELKEVIDKAITNINILIEIIKQQPTDNALDDLWILDKLNGFKNILKEVE